MLYLISCASLSCYLVLGYMPRPEDLKLCREYLKKGDLKSCLKTLFNITDQINTFRRDTVLLSSRLEGLERDYMKGTIDFDLYERKRNGFSDEILVVIERLDAYNQKTSTFTHTNKPLNPWKTMPSIGFILFSSLSIFFALSRPDLDNLLIKTYTWSNIFYEGELLGMMDLELMNKGEPINQAEFYFQIKEALSTDFRLASSFFPIRAQSDLIIEEDVIQDMRITSEKEGRIYMPLKEGQIFNLYIYFSQYKEQPTRDELKILLQGLEISRSAPNLTGSKGSIGKIKISKIQLFSVSPYYLFLPFISSLFFVILILNLLNWKK